MGQINISEITDPTQIIQPPVGVIGIYANNGALYEVNSNGGIFPLGGGARQISITVSVSEVNNLFSSPKTLIPASGNGVVNVVYDAYVKSDIQNVYGTAPKLFLYEGGSEETWTCNILSSPTGVNRQKFIPKVDPVSTTSSTIGVNEPITLSTETNNPTGGTGSLTIYLTWGTYDENTL